EYQFHLQC
ncbi:hypothetical protein D043_0870B, partial [Vibrio parahaemolyticus EKP-021]